MYPFTFKHSQQENWPRGSMSAVPEKGWGNCLPLLAGTHCLFHFPSCSLVTVQYGPCDAKWNGKSLFQNGLYSEFSFQLHRYALHYFQKHSINIIIIHLGYSTLSHYFKEHNGGQTADTVSANTFLRLSNPTCEKQRCKIWNFHLISVRMWPQTAWTYGHTCIRVSAFISATLHAG